MRIWLAFLLLLFASPSHAALDDPPMQWSLLVQSDRADGVVLVNGVPIHRFAKAGAKEKNESTTELQLGPWLVNGDNLVEVKMTRNAVGGTVAAQLIKSEQDRKDGDPERLIAPHAITYELEGVKGLPRWRFLDAEPLGEDQPNLLKAVAALHASAARGDAKAMIATRKPFFDDMTQAIGPAPDGYEQQLAGELKRATLAPLSDRLRVTTAHGGKLAIVETADGLAPVRGEISNGQMQIGQYWAKLDGQWLLVR